MQSLAVRSFLTSLTLAALLAFTGCEMPDQATAANPADGGGGRDQAAAMTAGGGAAEGAACRTASGLEVPSGTVVRFRDGHSVDSWMMCVDGALVPLTAELVHVPPTALQVRVATAANEVTECTVPGTGKTVPPGGVACFRAPGAAVATLHYCHDQKGWVDLGTPCQPDNEAGGN